MQMQKLVFAAVLCLVLAGCGGDDKKSEDPIGDAMRGNNPAGMPSGMPTGIPPGMPGSLPTGVPGPDMLSKGGTIKLTDEMMGRYVELIKALKGVDTPSAALLTQYKFSYAEWTGITQIIGGSTVRTLMTGARPQMEKQLAELKKKLESATPQQKPMLQMQIQAIEGQLKNMPAVGEANEVDKHNMEVIKRWKDRLEAAGN